MIRSAYSRTLRHVGIDDQVAEVQEALVVRMADRVFEPPESGDVEFESAAHLLDVFAGAARVLRGVLEAA